jgi:hypothetical protein
MLDDGGPGPAAGSCSSATAGGQLHLGELADQRDRGRPVGQPTSSANSDVDVETLLPAR